MVVHEFWRDLSRHGEVWAVEISDGKVFRACGPLMVDEVGTNGEILESLDYSTSRAGWIQGHRERFERWEAPKVVLREFWRDLKRHGEVWAVEIADGTVSRACGPFMVGEIDKSGELLDSLDYSTSRAGWIEGHRDRFERWEAPTSVIFPT